MGLVGTLILGGVTFLAGVLGLAFAANTVREFLEAVRVVTGPEELPDGDGERATYLAGTVADAHGAEPVVLGQVHDTFGYWLVRYWASGAGSNAFTMLGRVVMSVLYGPDDYRDEDDRRRGWAVVPSTVPAWVDGRRVELSFDEGAYPLQRLEADGGTVPFFAGAGIVVLGLLVLVSPVLPTLARLYPLAGLAVLGVVGLVVGGLVAGTVYHDTGLLGRWSSVTTLDDPSVPAELSAAGHTPDPADTARVDLVEVTAGDPLRIVGTVDPTTDGFRVTDGVVSTRGRWFLALAATLDAVRTLVFAVVCLLVAAVGVVLLFPSLLGATP